MKRKIFAMVFLLSALLVACSQSSTEEGNISTENDTKNIKELVRDFSMRNITDQSAVITPNQLIVQANGKDTIYDLSGEDFFVSIAPYIDQTHP